MKNPLYMGIAAVVVLAIVLVGVFYISGSRESARLSDSELGLFGDRTPDDTEATSTQSEVDTIPEESTAEVIQDSGARISVSNVALPQISLTYENVPPSGLRILNAGTGEVVWTEELGTGTGKKTIMVPAPYIPTGNYMIEVYTHSGVVTSSPMFTVENQTDTLYLAYKDIQFRPMTGITDSVAGNLCGVVFGDTCSWKSKIIGETPFYIYGDAVSQPLLSIESPKQKDSLSFGSVYTIAVRDPGPSAQRYRAFLVHRDSLGAVDGVHEAHILKSNLRNGAYELQWGLNEVYLDESGKEVVSQIKEGEYELMVANIDTGVQGGVGSTVRIGL